MKRRLLALVITCLTVITSVGPPAALADPPEQPGVGDSYLPVLVVLDTSGSMDQDSGDGIPRIEAARRAVRDLAGALDPETPFGVLAYPGRNASTVNGCVKGRLEVPISKVDLINVSAAVRQLSPDGDTPTGPALIQAAKLLKDSGAGHGTIVLVSDGESNCGEPPCQVAKQLSSEGFEVMVNTVGFQISDAGAKELQCIAGATGGDYIDADDPTELNGAMQDSGGAHLELTAMVPDPLAAVSGPGGRAVRLTVKNTGRLPANDVRLSLDFRDAGGRPGAVQVPRPVSFLGNIENPQEDRQGSRDAEMMVRPSPEQVGQKFTWTATAVAANAAPVVVTGETTVVEPFGHLTGLLDGISDVVVLGDSYSSGEGAYGTYIEGTDDKEKNLCHRSTVTYGRVLFDDAEIIACSGATINEFYQDQKNAKASFHMVVPQLMKLRGRTPPEAVLMSVGGNDALFGPVVKRCVFVADLPPVPLEPAWYKAQTEACRTFKDELTTWIMSMVDDLRGVYRDVDRAINDQESRNMRGGEVAPIVVVPYPRIVPPKGSDQGTSGCFAGISGAEVDFLNDYIDDLNWAIEVAVASVQNDGVPVYFASDVKEAFSGHTICDGNKRYANTFSLWDVTTYPHARDPEMAHPNADGYAAMARAISTWAAGQMAITDPKLPPPWKQRTVTGSKHRGSLSMGDLVSAGGRKSVFVGGYQPGETVALRVDSTPRMVGTAVADDDGVVHAEFVVPSDVPPGRHHLRILGFDPDGGIREQSVAIRVVPPHALAALLGLAAGIVLIGLGTVGMLIDRRSAGRTGDAQVPQKVR